MAFPWKRRTSGIIDLLREACSTASSLPHPITSRSDSSTALPGLILTSFSDLGLSAPLCKALAAEGYSEPTPIQAQTIGPLLKGRDVLGCAQTGTGKTAAFALPVLQHLAERGPSRGKQKITALVLTPTRELAAQIGESFTTYGSFLHSTHEVIFGGVNENPQIRALRKGFDILVATPGRLLDLMNRGFVDLSTVDFLSSMKPIACSIWASSTTFAK